MDNVYLATIYAMEEYIAWIHLMNQRSSARMLCNSKNILYFSEVIYMRS